jgi:hypothetical protein
MGTEKLNSNDVLDLPTQDNYTKMGSAGNLFILFIIIFCLIWIILFTFKPKIVRYIEKGEVAPLDNALADPARCFVGSLIISLVIILILWMVKSCR